MLLLDCGSGPERRPGRKMSTRVRAEGRRDKKTKLPWDPGVVLGRKVQAMCWLRCGLWLAVSEPRFLICELSTVLISPSQAVSGWGLASRLCPGVAHKRSPLLHSDTQAPNIGHLVFGVGHTAVKEIEKNLTFD